MKVAAIYLALACAWIVLSDRVLAWMPGGGDAETLARMQSLKGLLFVLVTTLLLYVLVVRSLRRQQATQQQYQDLVELSPNSIFVQQDEVIHFINSAGVRFFGAASASEIIGSSPFRFLHPDFHGTVRQRIAEAHKDGLPQPVLEERFIRIDGREVSAEVIAVPFSYQGRPAMQVILRDLSEEKIHAEHMAHLANHDTLTGLPNNALLKDRIGQQVIHARRLKRRLALLVLDVAGLHFINDSYGYAAGDQVLQHLAGELRAVVRPGDTVARIAGDEFAVLLSDLNDRAGLLTAIEKIRGSLVKTYDIAGREVFVTLHGGVTIWPEDGEDADTLLKNAISAAYRAKKEGSVETEFYARTMSEESRRRVTMELALTEAIESGQFLLHYQPKVDAHSGRIIGCEALIRWNNPGLGMVMPDQFIPLAEENGRIIQIGDWVIREACRQIAEWRSQGLGTVSVAVNLSARQLHQPGLIASISETLRSLGIAPRHLCVELTESMIMNNARRSIAAINRLQELGLHLSLDDFGTGYSSFSYLKTFTVDELKIDKSFVRDLHVGARDLRIVQAIIAIGHTLGIEVVAEGVETADQADILRELGCDRLQGYHFGRPMDALSFTELLRQSPVLPSGTGTTAQPPGF